MTAEQWHLDRCGSAVVDGQTVPACHLSEETAHDPRVTLTEAETDLLGPFIWGGWIGVAEGKRDAFSRELRATVEQIVAEHVAARLAPIRALAEEATERAYWDISLREMLTVQATGPERAKVPPHWRTQAESEALVPVDALRNALDAPQDAPRGPVSGEQGAEVAGGQGDAASELRRLHRIGSTPVGQVSTEDAEFYESHPLRDVLGGHARDFRLMVAEWLETR